MKIKYVMVEAEVSLDDFDEDDIVEYLESLGYFVTRETSAPIPALLAYEALRFNSKNAQRIVEEFICQSANKVAV